MLSAGLIGGLRVRFGGIRVWSLGIGSAGIIGGGWWITGIILGCCFRIGGTQVIVLGIIFGIAVGCSVTMSYSS